MRTLFSKHKWMQLVYGSLLMVAGVLVIVFALNDKQNVATWLSIITAITLFIYAAALLFSGVFSLKKSFFDIAFIYSVVFIAIGVSLLCNQSMIGQFIVIFVATLLSALGVVEIGEATAMVFFKRPVITIVIFYILGAVLITLGVLSFCFQTNVEQIVYVGVGALMCVTAVVQLILGFIGLHAARKLSKLENNKVVDAEIKEKEDNNVPSENKEEEHKIEA